jgi:GntR family transcriptional regulator
MVANRRRPNPEPVRRRLPAGLTTSAPLYKEVRRRLLQAVSDGEWKPADAIPSERRLAERFGVSVGTVRKAIDELSTENVLVRQQGRGTFVAVHNRDRMMFHFFHIVGRDGTKETPVVKLLSFKAARADVREAAGLAIAVGTPVFRIRNTLSLGGRPTIFDSIVIPQALFPGLTPGIFRDRPNTIYHLYQTVFGITVLRSLERLAATLADPAAAALLRVAERTPLLEINRVALTFHDAPVELRRSLVDTSRHEYFSDLAKSGQS